MPRVKKEALKQENSSEPEETIEPTPKPRTRRKVTAQPIIISSSSGPESDDNDSYTPEPKKKARATKSVSPRKKVKKEPSNDTETPTPKKRVRKAKTNDTDPAKPRRKKAKLEPTTFNANDTNEFPQPNPDQESTFEESEVKDNKPPPEELPAELKERMGTDGNSQFDMDWTEAEYISEMHNINYRISSNIVHLFDQENTVPFIARYRSNLTGGMEAEILRSLKESYDRAKAIKQRASAIIKSIDKLGKWTPSLHALIKSAKSLNTLDYINSMFKVPGKRSLAEKAKQLGLDAISESVLNSKPLCPLSSYINPSKEGLKTEKEVREGVIHILADIISKDKSLFDKIQDLRKTTVANIQVSQRKASAKEGKEAKVKTEHPARSKKGDSEVKYENYYDFKSRSNVVRPHQVLAINRGENNKFLTVKMSVEDNFKQALTQEFQNVFRTSLQTSQMHHSLMMESFEYAYKKNIEPAFIRRIRNELNEQAERASIEVFATNLKQLLLAPPFRGKTILGIDPGFSHGCKLALISETGTVLATDVVYIHQTIKQNSMKVNQEDAAGKLVNLVRRGYCTTIALGNGTACRETEVFLTELIQSGAFRPLDVSYTIVNEAGASVYSCGEEAKKEFPNMEYNMISAVSIARRLQDPLAELVKIEPKHLGVGMYQHDLPEKQLDATLNEVVIEAVSFVGVDVNTASLCLLKRIAGLTLSRAKAIIEWRTKNGSFTNRKQLLDVKGIGAKSFEQCAGFIRILPETAGISRKSFTVPLNPLDQTWIHPESYETAVKIIEDAGCNVKYVGTDVFIEKINQYARWGNAALAKRFNTEESTVEIIVKGLTAKKDYDIRTKSAKPLFRKSLKSMDDVEAGTTLRGEVRNVTHFGAFVDVGLSRDGLIPLKFMRGQTLGVGQRVEVRIKSIEKERNRICLELIEAY